MAVQRRMGWMMAGTAAALLLGGCAYNPFTDPNSYIGPGPAERVPTPLFQTPGCSYPGYSTRMWEYPWVAPE